MPVTNLRKAILESYPGPMCDLAYELGISQPLLSHWVTGRKTIPAVRLIELAEILHRNPKDLLGSDSG